MVDTCSLTQAQAWHEVNKLTCILEWRKLRIGGGRRQGQEHNSLALCYSLIDAEASVSYEAGMRSVSPQRHQDDPWAMDGM